MHQQPNSVEFHLPDWLPEYAKPGTLIPDLEARMSFVIEASRLNVERDTGGPFAAAVFERDSGRLISLGVNLVVPQGLSMLHAEMTALALAQRQLGTFDLGEPGLPALELVSTTEPCVMCLGGIVWSGVRRVVVGARDADARSVGFDEGPKPDNWKAALEERDIEVICDLQREAAKQVLETYARLNKPVYNPTK
jgi:tRNA(Arg) A34 adenosine deaminase TadA